MSKIPELEAPAEIYYDNENAFKYDTNTSLQTIQREITLKCIDLLEIKERGFVLDIGCGSGISGSVLSELNLPWIGVDISDDMLKLCKEKEEALEICKMDIGEGLQFLPWNF
ncbi:methyltransferase [Nosema bombycis CQ1]|uniref:Methyltransferase n=1 Tax=Nosema bombycis (strain CQ1 / CVCC 102059) TaxID=578461 RepID=R0KNK3_NOSB1|nr:methyltransferase [Nosema bombycis CQ1]|eukprot:EOB11747.1 methyltransferase [Nosema bombycis CQ1]